MPSLAQTLSDARSDLPNSLGTADLRKLGANILRQSIFSARMSNATAVQAVREAITGVLSGVKGQSADNVAEARLKLKYIGQALSYDPASGFPGENAEPAEAGSLRDLFSTDRINLILKTQEMMTPIRRCAGLARIPCVSTPLVSPRIITMTCLVSMPRLGRINAAAPR